MATIQDTLKTKMDVLDTLHDFCKSERGDGDAAGDKRLDFMRPYITNLLKNKVSALSGKSELNAMIKTLTDDQVTSISKLEHQTVDFFETKYTNDFNLTPESKLVITYDEILNSWTSNNNEKTNPLWESMRTNQGVTILEIVKGKSFNPDKFTLDQLKILGNFILNFFFGLDMFTEVGSIGAAKNVRVTFDAKTGLPGKIFTEINQVYNVMFPQTIADSATTSLNILKGRSEYIFPDGGKTSKIESATFSTGEYELSYVNKGFATKNPFGFSLDIKNKQNNATISAPFSSTQTEGPSVNYIIDILKLASEKKAAAQFKSLDASKKGNILSLGKAIDGVQGFKEKFIEKVGTQSDGLLPDIKRSGDHEATIATRKTRNELYKYFMFTTIDILCALKSRNEKNPTIWHNAHHLILYRFPPSEAAIAQAKYDALVRSVKTSITMLNKCINVKKDLEDNLAAQKEKFTKGKGAYFSLVKKGGDAAAIETTAESIVTMMARMRMLALEAQVKEAKTILESFTKDLQKPLNILQKVEKLPKATLEAAVATEKITVTIESKNENIAEILTGVKTDTQEFFTSIQKALDIYVDEPTLTTKGLERKINFTKEITEEKTLQNGTKVSIFLKQDFPLFQYYPQNFLDFYESLLSISSLKVPEANASSSAQRKYNAAFDKALETYQDEVNSILQQFSEKAIPDVEQLFAVLDISKLSPHAGITDKLEARRAAAREYFQGQSFTNDLKTYVTSKGITEPFTLPSPLQGGQRGGAQDLVLQHYDLSYLLFNISSIASGFFESAYNQEYPLLSLLYFHNELVHTIGAEKTEENFSVFFNKFVWLYNSIAPYIKKKSTTAEAIKFYQVTDPNTASNYRTIANILDGLNKLADFFNSESITNISEPTLTELFTTLITKGYNEDNVLENYVTEMLLQWSMGYTELVYNSGYDFVEGDATSALISFLLSLDADSGQAKTVFTNSLSRRVLDNQAAIQSEFAKIPQEHRLLAILFAFTCLENVMNKTKESPFIKNTTKTEFSSKKEWQEGLYSFLTTLIDSIQKNLGSNLRLKLGGLAGGGARKWKMKKTRRHRVKKRRSTRRRKN